MPFPDEMWQPEADAQKRLNDLLDAIPDDISDALLRHLGLWTRCGDLAYEDIKVHLPEFCTEFALHYGALDGWSQKSNEAAQPTVLFAAIAQRIAWRIAELPLDVAQPLPTVNPTEQQLAKLVQDYFNSVPESVLPPLMQPTALILGHKSDQVLAGDTHRRCDLPIDDKDLTTLRARLVGILVSLSFDPTVAEELAQAALLKFGGLEHNGQIQLPLAYLTTIARNLFKQEQRHRRSQDVLLEEDTQDHRSPAPDAALQGRELNEIVKAGILSLKPKAREVMIASSFDELENHMLSLKVYLMLHVFIDNQAAYYQRRQARGQLGRVLRKHGYDSHFQE